MSISVPVNVTVPTITLLGWVSILDMAVAAETDAGRPAMAKALRSLRDGIGSALPAVLRVNEDRE